VRMKEFMALTIVESAKRLRVSKPVALGLIRKGEIVAVRCGRQWRIHPDSINDFLKGKRGGNQNAANQTTS
jgi:excisionase family DNA binding protein